MMTANLPIDDSLIEGVRSIASLLNSRAPLSAEEREALFRPYSRRAFDVMLRTGATYGEATGAPGTALQTRDEGEFRAHLRSIDNDLKEQLRIVREGVEHYFAHGEWPAPYYAWRIAVILRKAREPSTEAEFCEAFARHFRDGPGARYSEIAERAKKARMLAGKVRD